MLELSVSIDAVFGDRDFAARFDAVANAGIHAFEFWWWIDKDLDAIVRHQERLGLTVAAFILCPQVCLLDEDARPAFVEATRESCRVAQRLGCRRLIVNVDNVSLAKGAYPRCPPWYTFLSDERLRTKRQAQRRSLVAALKAAAPIAESEGVTLALEPLNTQVDHVGYWLVSSQEGFEIVQEVNSPAVRLLYDVYHQQISEGNLIYNLTSHIDLVGHIHIGDVPGRHEPGTGEINFLNLLCAVRRAGYEGYVGLEYFPSTDPAASLKHITQIIAQVNQRLTEEVHVCSADK